MNSVVLSLSPDSAHVRWPFPPEAADQLAAYAHVLQDDVHTDLLFTPPPLKPGEELEIPFRAHTLPTGFVPVDVPADHFYWLQLSGDETLDLNDAKQAAAAHKRVHVLLEAAQALGLMIPTKLILACGRVTYYQASIFHLYLRFALPSPDGTLVWFELGDPAEPPSEDKNPVDFSALRLAANSQTALHAVWDFHANARVAEAKWEEAQRLKREADRELQEVKRQREELEREKKAVIRYSAFPAAAIELLRSTPAEQKARISRTAAFGNQFAIFENPDDQKIALRLIEEIERGNKQAWYLQTVPTRDEALALISVVTLAEPDMPSYKLTDAASGMEVPGYLVPYDQPRLMEGMGFERQQKSDGRFRFQDKEKRRLEKALIGLESKKTHIVQAFTTHNEQGKQVRRFVKTNQPISLVRQIEVAEIEATGQNVPRAADYSKFLFLPAELFANPRYAQIPRDLGLRIKQIETRHEISRREHTPVFLLGLYDAMQPRLDIHLDTLMTRLSISKSDLKKRGLPYVKAMIEDSCRVAQELGVLKAFAWQTADDGGLELVLELDPAQVPSMRLPQSEREQPSAKPIGGKPAKGRRRPS